jgi:hypothetical protein
MAIGAGRSGNPPRVPLASIPISTRNIPKVEFPVSYAKQRTGLRSARNIYVYVFPPFGTRLANHANLRQPGTSGLSVSSPPPPLTVTIALVSLVLAAAAGFLASTSLSLLTPLAKLGLPAR